MIASETYMGDIVYIIQSRNDKFGRETWIDELHLMNGEYNINDSITLAEIEKQYPDIKMVITETPLHGEVYRFNNHYEGGWEHVGTTIGYA